MSMLSCAKEKDSSPNDHVAMTVPIVLKVPLRQPTIRVLEWRSPPTNSEQLDIKTRRTMRSSAHRVVASLLTIKGVACCPW